MHLRSSRNCRKHPAIFRQRAMGLSLPEHWNNTCLARVGYEDNISKNGGPHGSLDCLVTLGWILVLNIGQIIVSEKLFFFVFFFLSYPHQYPKSSGLRATSENVAPPPELLYLQNHIQCPISDNLQCCRLLKSLTQIYLGVYLMSYPAKPIADQIKQNR